MKVNPEKPFISRNFKLHDEGKVYDAQNSLDRPAIIEAFIKRNFLRNVIENGDLDTPRQDEQAHLCVKMLDYCKSEELNKVLVNTSVGRLLMRHGQHRGFANLLARTSETVQTRNLMKGAASELLNSGDPAVAEFLFNRILPEQSPETQQRILLSKSFGNALKDQQEEGNLPPAIVEECVAGLLSSDDNTNYLCVDFGDVVPSERNSRRNAYIEAHPGSNAAKKGRKEERQKVERENCLKGLVVVGRRLTTPEA